MITNPTITAIWAIITLTSALLACSGPTPNAIIDGNSDGFDITKDTQTAKPQVFRPSSGWFSYNPSAGLRSRYSV